MPGPGCDLAREDQIQIAQLLSTYKGRMPLSTYWWYLIILPIIGIAFNILGWLLAAAFFSLGLRAVGVLFLLLPLAFVIPCWRVALKRGHDLNHSAAYIFILMFCIPVIGPLWLFVELGFISGTVGDNRYGPDPAPRPQSKQPASPASGKP